MPGRLRQSAGQSSESAQQTQTYDIAGLDFSEALTWRAGKAIAVADLLSRLKKLGNELRNLEQGQIAAGEFTRLAQDLAHSNLLGHKDKGVRAWVLSSIVDILNICAPDAPFNPAQLKDIFTVVVNTILPALADPSNAYNAQHVYILNSLTDYKSIVLITDLENADALIVPLFTICFDIVSGAGQNGGGVELAKSVEFQLRSMLVTIIDEVNLPQEATDIILSQFLRVDPRTTQTQPNKGKKSNTGKDKNQDTLGLKDYPPAYNMAKSICTTCPDKMTVQVTQYFGNLIMNASASLDDNGVTKTTGRKVSEVDESDDEDDNLADLRKAHRLVRELWRACPDVLQNVIPQIETELAADSTSLRQLATEALGDIIAGIGISGLPPSSNLDPAAYPLPSIEDPEPALMTTNPLLLPASPKPFSSIHASAYQAFQGRCIDRSPVVRSTWVTAISRILLTDAGGIGISGDDKIKMLSSYAQTLRDVDEKVRHTAIQSICQFDYHGIVNILGSDGGLSKQDTVISTLADRVTDRKVQVREEATLLLGRMWGVASRDIENGVESVVAKLGTIPSRLLNAMYANDMHAHMLVYKVLYECLLPIFFPSIKGNKADNQKPRGKSSSQSQEPSTDDADSIRVRRILTMVHGLDAKAKPIFSGIQKRQVDMGRAMKVLLQACEDYNGGIVDADGNEDALKDALTKYISQFSKQFPDPTKVTSDLWKFAKMHDRRSYQLIKFAIGTENDYRTMSKAIKELLKRIREGPSSSQSVAETLQPLLYRSALIVFNRSHVPAIMEISRSDYGGLAETAHEMLKEISARNPEVLKSHVQALCKELQDNAPAYSKPEISSAADTLKACADFARKYPDGLPKDRKFLSSMNDYALFSLSPRAAKHAVTILLTVSNKKEFHAKELLTMSFVDCRSTLPQYRARLATISQICLLAPVVAKAEEKQILELALDGCLRNNDTPATTGYESNAWEADPSDEMIAKRLALKIIVNRCRSADEKEDAESFDTLAKDVIALLMQIIEEEGEIASSKDTPSVQRNELRLAATCFLLKLCAHKRRCEELVSSSMFKTVALVVINPPNAVRTGFVYQLQKYLSRTNLHPRWYTVLFLLAFEPDTKLKNEALAYLKSRVLFFTRQQQQALSAGNKSANIMETLLARLLSLLAHHPDYPSKDTAEFDGDLLDFSKYIIFYLQAVANEENLSLIFHIAQRVKQTKDSVTGDEAASEHLYVLSDLAQAVIRNYADLMPAHAKGVNLLQTWPGRVTLPIQLFSALPNHTEARDIAAKNYLPDDVALSLERLVRAVVKGTKSSSSHHIRRAATERKRKSSESVDLDDDEADERRRSIKKSRNTSLPIRKTPKSTKRKSHDASLSVEQPSRKSARVSAVSAVNYVESDEDEDEDMDDAPAASSPIARIKPRTIPSRKEKEASLEPVQEEQQDDEGDMNGDEDENEQPGDGISDDHDDEKENEVTQDGQQQSLDGTADEPDEEVDASDREGTPSPLRENKNGRTRAGRSRSKTTPKSTKSTPAKKEAEVKAKPSKSKAETTASAPASTRRSTRNAKA